MNLKHFMLSMAFVSMPVMGQTHAVGVNTYGTQSEIAYTIPSDGFKPMLSDRTWTWSDSSVWMTNGGGCCFSAPLILPSGAMMIALDIEGCDFATGIGGSLFGSVAACPSPNQTCNIAGNFVDTGDSAAPGCARFRTNFFTPVTIDNDANNYHVEVSTGATVDGAVSLRSARVIYKLQVSPAPGTATFTDVPTSHPFFQFIEALAASGITAGCSASPPQFCPNAPLTRGQMAVFLARALGLHFTP